MFLMLKEMKRIVNICGKGEEVSIDENGKVVQAFRIVDNNYF